EPSSCEAGSRQTEDAKAKECVAGGLTVTWGRYLAAMQCQACRQAGQSGTVSNGSPGWIIRKARAAASRTCEDSSAIALLRTETAARAADPNSSRPLTATQRLVTSPSCNAFTRTGTASSD